MVNPNRNDLYSFLVNMFDHDDEVTTFCFDQYEYVYRTFTGNTTLMEKIKLLSEDSIRHGYIDELRRQVLTSHYLKRGEKILQLLEGLDQEPVVVEVRKLYQFAYQRRLNEPEGALQDCQKALEEIDPQSDTAVFDHSMRFAYSRGQFYLLIASIQLNEGEIEADWQVSARNYSRSREEFRTRGWSHLEGLASLGLAIARRKSGEFEEALNACSEAKNSAGQASIPGSIKMSALRQAIAEEYSRIQEIRERFQKIAEEPDPTKKELKVFKLSAGEEFIAERGTVDVNLFSLRDYERNAEFDWQTIDLEKFPLAGRADYILQVDKEVEKPAGGLQQGDWVFIQAENKASKLNNKKVVVLEVGNTEDQKIQATIKTFFRGQDHYFLKSKGKNIPSVIIATYNSNPDKMMDYYYHETVDRKFVYEIRISGRVVTVIPPEKISSIIAEPEQETGTETPPPGLIWRIPVVSDVSAGLGYPIKEEAIKDYVELDPRHDTDSDYFILEVEGDSMSGDGIFSGDRVLIRRQNDAENGKIAAIVVQTPELGRLGLLKQYHFEERENIQHWFLESSNPAYGDLVIVPFHTDMTMIQKMYRQRFQAKKGEFHKDAELRIAGIYIEVVERAKKN